MVIVNFSGSGGMTGEGYMCWTCVMGPARGIEEELNALKSELKKKKVL